MLSECYDYAFSKVCDDSFSIAHGGGNDVGYGDIAELNKLRAANCYDFGVAATLFNPDYAATLVTSMLRL